MQLSREQLIKLDNIIERYSEDETIEEASTIREYLKLQSAKIQELLITVYFNLSRQPTEKERKIIAGHKFNLFNQLQAKGYIRNERKRTTKINKQKINHEDISQRLSTSLSENEKYKEKLEKLNRYSNLIRILEALNERLYLLKEKQGDQVNIKAVDYSKVKIKNGVNKYDFKSINIISDIQDTENQIKHFENELKQEKTYLIGIFASLPGTIKIIFNLQYIHQKTWEEIANITGMSENWCIIQHIKNLEILDI